jgi:hypothetical protein
MPTQMTTKLKNFNGSLTEAEKANFKLLLGLAAGGLAPDFSKPHQGLNAQAFDTVSETLAGLQPYSARIPYNGLAFRGRPDFLTDKLLASLQDEAKKLRPSARRFEEHFLGCGAPIANQFAISPQLHKFVTKHAGKVEATGIASFLFYDEEGQGIDPHIDSDIFSLNVLIMLEHNSISAKRSRLVVFPPHSDPERLDLQPGEMIVMYAGSIAHGRERISYGENVTILTFGFTPLSD